MINCEKMALFCFVFIAMVYENYKFLDTYVCSSSSSSIVVYNILDRERLGGLNWLSLLNFYVL